MNRKQKKKAHEYLKKQHRFQHWHQYLQWIEDETNDIAEYREDDYAKGMLDVRIAISKRVSAYV